VATKEDNRGFVTGFAFGPPEANLGYHWSCAEKLGVPRPPCKIDVLRTLLKEAYEELTSLREEGSHEELIARIKAEIQV
jgi:hypothetical protein